MAEFSYERNVAPYTSKFFGAMAADRRLSPESRLRIQTEVLSGVNAIEEQRLKLQEEREQGVLRKQRMDYGLLQMEETRRQMRDRQAKVERSTMLNQSLRSVLDDPSLSPEEKRQRVAKTALENADDDDVRTQAMFAMESLPTVQKEKRDGMTMAQMLDAAARGIDPETISSGDPVRIAQAMAQKVKEKESADEEAKRVSENKELRKQLLTKPMKFKDKYDQKDPDYLEDESHNAAKVIIQFGTPEEQKAFEAAGRSNNDTERARIAQAIQVREISKLLSEQVTPRGQSPSSVDKKRQTFDSVLR